MPEAEKRGNWRLFFAGQASGVVMLTIFLFLTCLVFHLLSDYFLTWYNILTIMSNMSFIGLMALAGTPLIIAGGLDMSVASIAGLTGVIIALLNGKAGVNIWLSCVAAIAAAAAVGLFNGLLAAKIRLNPLIATLGTMGIISGAALVLTGGLTEPVWVEEFNYLGSGRILEVPVPVIIMLTILVVLWWMLMRTRFGRFIYAAGSNPEASFLVGIPMDRLRIILYVISGLSGALAGIILTAMLGAAAPKAADVHLLTIVSAIILGGTSLNGGRGTVGGTLLAVMILGTLNNGLTLMDVSSFWQDITRGVVLLLAVSLDQLRTKLSET